MSYLEYNQISQNLYLRSVPERKYPPRTISYCSPCDPILYCQDLCYTDCCHCHCCCSCCCCYNFCYKPYLHFDYSTKKSEDLIKNKYSIKKPEDLNKNKKRYIKPKENINYSKNQNEEIKTEINEQPKEENNEENNINNNPSENYEQNQFNEFMKKLMKIEAQIEDNKIALSMNSDFNCEDVFRLFESNNKDNLDKNDLKAGLNLFGINPTDQQLNLLMKRFDLQKAGHINYADFFDMIVPFEKNQREIVENRQPKYMSANKSPDFFNEKTKNDLKNLFELIINCEDEINNDRKNLGTLRLKLKDIFGLLDKDGKGYFEQEEMMVYFTNNALLDNNKEADLLFIRLDKNRNGRIDFQSVEDELQTLY